MIWKAGGSRREELATIIAFPLSFPASMKPRQKKINLIYPVKNTPDN